MTTVVTGASGHVGANLVRALLARGCKVRVLVHEHHEAIDGLGVEIAKGDVRHPDSLAAAFRGAEVAYHLAGRISIAMDSWRELESVNMLGTRHVVEACLGSGVKRLVHFSSIHAIAQEPFDSPVDESRPFVGGKHPAYDRSKAAGCLGLRSGLPVSEQTFFHWLLTGWLVLAAIVFILLFFVTAPYGRHLRPGWGPAINSRLGWVAMESVAAIAFALFFVLGSQRTLVSFVFLAMWEAHYIHRAFIYPFSRPSRNDMTLLVILLGALFNLVNAYLNGRYLFSLSVGYPVRWLVDPRFIAGLLLFIAGFIINRQSDGILRRLRVPGDNGYGIPEGGLYRWVSSPNYLGEMLIWGGWALATWSLPTLAFALWTAANLVPRARANHSWYKARFPDYPTERRALVPGL